MPISFHKETMGFLEDAKLIFFLESCCFYEIYLQKKLECLIVQNYSLPLLKK